MKAVDLVQLGTMILGMPEVGRLYTHLVQDAVVGREASPGVDNYARIMGVGSRRTVSRALDTLDRWGLVARTGSRRSQRYDVYPTPNLLFCHAIVEGMFGTEVYNDVLLGRRRAELISTTDHGDPVAAYALASLLAYYGDSGVHPLQLPEPSDATGKGYVGLHYPAIQSRKSMGQDSLFSVTESPDTNSPSENLISSSWGFGTRINPYSFSSFILTTDQGSTVCLYKSQKPNIAVYSDELPLGFVLPLICPKKSQAAKKRREAVPQTSSGFVYWAKEDLWKDAAYYATITNLVEYGNTLFQLGETLNWQLYIRVRTCLVENELSADQIRKAFKAASVDVFWKDKASVGMLCKDPNRIRELSRKSGHDPYVRSTAALPQLRGEAGDAIAF